MERRILVVEDSPTQAERVRLLLEAEGYRVEVAANGREGFHCVQSAPPDLIISDVVMPEMDGFALCRAVKSAEATRRIPFVLLTQRSTPPDVIQGFEAGADNFIPKPFADDALLERVRRIFEQMDRQACEGPEPEVTLHVDRHRFVVSARKAQIVELLLFTLEDLARVNGLLQARERDLEAKARELETFTYTVSHDLKAPLRGMEGFARALQEDYADRLDETGRHYLDMICGSARRMGDLIDDLLKYSRLERRAMTWEPIDLERLVQGLMADRQAEITARGVRIDLSLPFRRFACEREGLQQALANLLDNALKFTRTTAQPAITIRTEENDAERVLTVADNGIGFDPKYAEKIFDIFQRLHPQDEYEGTGIGLAIVRKVAERHGGRAWAESEPGKGATFYVAIPAGRRAQGVNEPLLTILLVEDNPVDLELTLRALQKYEVPNRVVVARDGEEALDYVHGRGRFALDAPIPGLILLDIRLPKVDGIEVLREIKQHPIYRTIPVVMLTTSQEEADVRTSYELGAHSYIAKPVELDKYMEAISRINQYWLLTNITPSEAQTTQTDRRPPEEDS